MSTLSVSRRGQGGRTAARRGARTVAKRRQAMAAWLFALPFVVVFGVFTLLPLLSSVAMSFTDFRSTDVQTPTAVNFVGLQQYARVLGDPQFRRALLNTAYFVLVGIPLTMAVALLLAVALNTGITRFRTVFRVGFYTPVVTSVVAVAVVWRFILQPDGLLNRILATVGISGPDWLHSSVWALPSLIVMAAWRNMGTLMVIFLAGLQGIPADLNEAAMVDGAGAWHRFRHITLPLMRPPMLLGAVLLSVVYLQFFEEPFVMTQGGPLDATLSITYFTFKQFGFGSYGTATAASYLLFLAIALLSFVQFRLLRAKD